MDFGGVVTAGDVTEYARGEQREAERAAWRLDVAPAASEVSRRREAVVRRGLAAADTVAIYVSLIAAAAVGAGWLRWPALLVPLPFIMAAKAIGLYDRDEHVLHKTTLEEAPLLFGIGTAMTLLLWFADEVVTTASFEKLQVLVLWVTLFALLVALRAVSRALAAAGQPPERCLVIGDPEEARFLRDQFEISPTIRAEVVGVAAPARPNGNPDELRFPPELGELLADHRIDRVVVSRPRGALEGADQMLTALRELKSYGVRISLLPKGPRVAGLAVEPDNLPGVTLLGIRGLGLSRSSRFVKRAFDIFGSALGLALLSPFLALIAVAVKIDSRGPVLFRQRRIGRDGNGFTMLKFRSMVSNAEQMREELRALSEGGPGLFKIAGDPRITRVGKLLRRASLDELPQLWNVLAGQMSLVGPRPLIPEEDEEILGRYRRRLEVRPGITGNWQILCSSRRIPLPEMVRLDYLYVATWTLWSDIRLLLQTLPFVVGARGV